MSREPAAGTTPAELYKPVQYVDVPLEAGRQTMLASGMPEWITDGFVELLADFSMNWGDRISPAVEQLTGHPGRSVDDFLAISQIARCATDLQRDRGGRKPGAAAQSTRVHRNKQQTERSEQ